MSTILGFIGGFLTALFAEPARQWIFRPRLALEFKDSGHFVAKTAEESKSPPVRYGARYIRIKVTNTKSALAKSCKAYLANIERLGQSGIWEATEYCESLQLRWAGRGYEALDLPKDVPHFVDVVSTREVSKSFRLETQVTLMRYEMLLNTKGTYRVTIVVSGDGVEPARIQLSFEWDGSWDNFEVATA